MKWKSWLARIVAGIVILIVASALWVSHIFSRSVLPSHHSPVVVDIKSGSGLDQFLAQLAEKKMLSHPKLTREWMLFRGYEKCLKAGEYIIRPGMSILDVIEHVVTGKANYYRVTLIPGWTYRDVAQELDLPPKKLVHYLDIKYTSIEGLLYPDTYFVASKKNNKAVLERAYKKMQEVLKAEWADRDTSIPYKNVYQALIAASLIEKETAKAEERALVSGVIVNRLKKGMRLQIDPTVMYGLEEQYNRPPTPADLKARTPYNTYRHYGLPPTPIALVSRASLRAALHPKPVPYLYYFADFSGGHVFSCTLEEHREAIRAKKAAIQFTNDIVKDAQEAYKHLISSMLDTAPRVLS